MDVVKNTRHIHAYTAGMGTFIQINPRLILYSLCFQSKTTIPLILYPSFQFKPKSIESFFLLSLTYGILYFMRRSY